MTERIWPEGAISMEDAIDNLQGMRNLYDEGVMADSLDLAIQAVRSMQWNSVEDRMPEENGEYLVTVELYDGGYKRKVSAFRWFRDGMCYSWEIETSPVYKVVAWCELPPIWEGLKNDN